MATRTRFLVCAGAMVCVVAGAETRGGAMLGAVAGAATRVGAMLGAVAGAATRVGAGDGGRLGVCVCALAAACVNPSASTTERMEREG